VVLIVDMAHRNWEPRARTSARAHDRPTGKLNGASRPASPLVLVVDDEEPVRYAVRDALHFEGYTVETAANGAEALEKVKTQTPSAIVLDLMMPVMDGWAFGEACRRVPYFARIPILAISAAYGLRETAARLHEMGVSAVLAKPFDLDALLGAGGAAGSAPLLIPECTSLYRLPAGGVRITIGKAWSRRSPLLGYSTVRGGLCLVL
jgi:two-component system, chemotaxis family, chemotaxis protein CheY